MKWLKRITISIILMIITLISMISSVNAADIFGEPSSDPWFNSHSLTGYRNLYCVQPGQELPRSYPKWAYGYYYRKLKVVINGNTAKFTSLCGGPSGTIVAKENNILAALVTETKKDGRTDYTYGYQSSAWYGVQRYMNTWIDAMVLNGKNLATDNTIEKNAGSSHAKGINAIDKAKELANKYNYNVTLYFYRNSAYPVKHYQSLMSAHFKEPTQNGPTYAEVSGTVWKEIPPDKGSTINGIFDSSDKRLEGIAVTLVSKSGATLGTAKTNSNGEYTIKVKIDSDATLSNLEQSYVKFEYNGMEYTTVAYATEGVNKSKAKEDEKTRNTIDSSYSKVTPETKKVTTHNITASTQGIITLKPGYTHMTTETRGADSYRVFKEVNLGLFKRDNPDISIESNLDKVEVTMNGQKYTYLYNKVVPDTSKAEVQAQFQNKQSYTYRRPVNPADIAYLKETASDNALSMFVTYSVKVTNEANYLIAKVNSMINSYDKNYTLVNVTKDGTNITANVENAQPGTEFSKVTINNLGIELQAQTSATIQIKYQVNRDAIIGLLNKDATISNAVELGDYTTLYSGTTLYAEQRTGGRNNKAYGGFDKDSHPGNAAIDVKKVSYTYVDDNSNKTTYENEKVLIAGTLEDDTDIAPSLLLCKDNSKTLSGIIWEDVDKDVSDGQRLGNGYYENTEKTVGNVKIELFNLDGTPAILYDNAGNKKENGAVVYSGADGKYAFEGVVTGEYFIKFIYGNDEAKMGSGKVTTINGTVPPVNARNYKSTIITDGAIRNILSKDYSVFSEEEKRWHINHTDGYSVAVDNMKERLSITDLQYSNYDTGVSISAYTRPFKTLVEFINNEESEVNADGDITGVNHELIKLDFGISERPREDLIVQKTITNLRLTLANGQELINGNPTEQSLSYAKAMGLKSYNDIRTGAQARSALQKQLLIEVDAELIQGAQLILGYKVKVINNNEIDYDYEADYADIKDTNYITTNSKANYYYYGEKDGLEEMKATIEFVDYMNSELVYNTENTQWIVKNKEDISNEYTEKLISEEVANAINNKYQMLVPATKAVTLARGGDIELEMSGSKLLANNKEENVYDNSLEIIKIDGKTARTIQEVNEVVQEKSYKPGNYVPSLDSGMFEQDDDRVKVIITPPTGTENYIITYVVTGLIGLVVIVGGIVFIKKKVLTK